MSSVAVSVAAERACQVKDGAGASVNLSDVRGKVTLLFCTVKYFTHRSIETLLK